MQYENFSFTKLSLPCLCPGWHVTDSWPAPVSWPLLLPYSWQHITHCIVLLPSPLPPAFHSSLHYFHLISQPPELLNSWPYLSTSPALRTSRGSAVHCTDRGSCATLLFLSSAHCCTRWLLFTTSPQRRVDIVDNIYFSLNTTDICVQTLYRNVETGCLVASSWCVLDSVHCCSLHTLVTLCSCPSPHITPHLHCRCCPIVLHYLVTDTSNSII